MNNRSRMVSLLEGDAFLEIENADGSRFGVKVIHRVWDTMNLRCLWSMQVKIWTCCSGVETEEKRWLLMSIWRSLTWTDGWKQARGQTHPGKRTRKVAAPVRPSLASLNNRAAQGDDTQIL